MLDSQTTPIRVLCVEDHAIIAMDLQETIDNAPDMCCLGYLLNADELVIAALEKQPDVVLLDLTMPGRDPLDALGELSRICPQIRTIVFSGTSDEGLIEQAFESGAWGCVTKNSDLTPVLDAIRRVSQGEFVLRANAS